MPHMVQALTKLAAATKLNFSLALQTLEETVSFSMFQPGGPATKDNQAAPSAFATASLDDCGLGPDLLKVFCASNTEEENPVNIVRDLVHTSEQGFLVNTQSAIGQS